MNTSSLLTPTWLKEQHDCFHSRAENKCLQSAVAQLGCELAAVDIERQLHLSVQANLMTHVIDNWRVADQKHTGRCWIFAGLNLLRAEYAVRYGKLLEFSSAYLYFYDKLERSEFTLRQLWKWKHKAAEDRLVSYLLDDAYLMNDGGQWNMFVNLVEKYGLLPQHLLNFGVFFPCR